MFNKCLNILKTSCTTLFQFSDADGGDDDDDENLSMMVVNLF